MRDVAVATVLLTALLTAVGMPWAVVLRRHRDGWVALLVEAVMLGLLWLPLLVTVYSWLGWWGLVPGVGAWAWPVVAVARGRRPLPPVRSPRRIAPGEVAVGLGWVVVLAGAGLLRLREVNFLPWVGDMGAYVNWANEFVRTGELQSVWPPVFSAYLSVSTFLFGTDDTTIGMATTGMVLVVATARLAQLLGAHRWIALAGGAVVAGSVHTVWYSSFPASESLNAPVFVLWVVLVLRALEAPERRPWFPVAAAGLALLGLGLLRGSGMLLVVPLTLVVLAVVVVPAWRHLLGRAWWLLAASGAAVAVTYWYGVTVIRLYFVQFQFADILPAEVYGWGSDQGLFSPSPALVLLLASAVVGLVLVGVLVVPRVTPPEGSGRRSTRGPASSVASSVVLVAVATVLGVVVGGHLVAGDGLGVILQRVGPGLLAVAVLGVVSAAWLRSAPHQVAVLLLAVTATAFLALQGRRLEEVTHHSFFLYWDRYVVSEPLPALVVLAAVAVSSLLGVLTTRRQVPVGAREVSAAVVGVTAAALVVVPGVPTHRLMAERVFMAGAYELTTDIAVLIPEGTETVYWSADAVADVQGFFFPNTWMAFAVPLERSFGYDVVNADQVRMNNFRPDDVLTADTVRRLAACQGIGDLVVLEADTWVDAPAADVRLLDAGLEIEYLGTVVGSVPFLRQPPGDGWYEVRFQVAGWRVSAPDAWLDEGPPGCWPSEGGTTGERQLVR